MRSPFSGYEIKPDTSGGRLTQFGLRKEAVLKPAGLEQCSVSELPGRDPVPGPGINYTGPREILLELITNLNMILYL